MTDRLLLTYYGDDFTGSTDVMEQLELGGVPTVLFLDVPTEEQLAAFPDVRAVGIAGVSRSMTPAEMDAELPAKFTALAQLGAPFFHYKVCSTFDSSPTIGNIGHALEIGWRIFAPEFVPVIVGAPFLRRYVAFGNLFARIGDTTYRLDRHPTMRQHPITPMTEADLRMHLGQQTARPIALIDYLQLSAETPAALHARLDDLLATGADLVLFDTMNDANLERIGALLWERRADKPIFVVGSSGVERALTRQLQPNAAATSNLVSPGPAKQMIVMSGSAAPDTRDQIQHALEAGFVGLQLPVPQLLDPSTRAAQQADTVTQALQILGTGRSVLLYSAMGPDDPLIQQTRAMAQRIGLEKAAVGQIIGQAQGQMTKALIETTGIRRVCVAGGDTSGHVAQQLGIYALQAIQTIAPGAPLCRARSSDAAFDGLEIALKGGQNGGPDYFEAILRGSAD